jgi:tetratricopeptide (TPR) repeat protein
VASERNAAQRAADEARRAAGEAEAVNAFLTDDLLGQADPDANARDKKVTVEELLAKAAARIEGNPKFTDKPGVEATLRLTIGWTYFRLGKYEQAERHLQRALDLRRNTFGDMTSLALSAQERLAECIHVVRPPHAVPLAEAAWKARIAVHGPNDLATLDSLNIYCMTLQDVGRAADTVDLLQPALQARRRTQGDNHRDVLLTTQYLAMGLTARGEFADAVRQYQAILAAPRETLLDSDYLVVASDLGFLQYVRGDLNESERLLDECVALSRRLNGTDHHETDRLRGLRLRVRLDRGQVAGALTEAAEILALRTGLYTGEHFMTANILLDLGWAQELSGKSKEAEASLAKALKIYAVAPPQSPYFVGWAEYWYARTLTTLNRHAQAEHHFIAAEERLRASPMTPARHYRQAVEKLVQFYDAGDKREKAAEWRKRLADLPGTGGR